MKNSITTNLKLLNYHYYEDSQKDEIVVDLGSALEVYIDVVDNRVTFSNRLRWGNLLTGIPFSIKSAMYFNTLILFLAIVLLFGIYESYQAIYIGLLVIGSVWIVIWTLYYMLKSELFIHQVMDWIVEMDLDNDD